MSILVKGMRKLPRIAVIVALLAVLVATPIVASAATAPSSGEEITTPVFPSPVPWFDWGQRYVNRLVVPLPYTINTYLKGFGNYEPDIIIGGEPYKNNITLGPDWSVSYRAYLKSTGDPQELHWYMRGSDNGTVATVFDGDLLNFEYPLYLGKTWEDNTTITYPGFQLSVNTKAEAVAYIEPVLDESGSVVTYNVQVADGYDYQLPDLNGNRRLGDDVAAIPLPRKELGDISWEAMKALPDNEAEIGWNDVVVPAGPYAGQNIQGYYAVKQTITTTSPAGYPVSRMTMEAWKDVRGCVPVQVVQREQWSATGHTTLTTMTVAQRWTGNFPWFQYEFGGPCKTFGVRVDDTAIREGGHTFQFTTATKDFGLKYAGDAMVVDMDNGVITIDYEDSYISCDAGMVRVHDDLWFGIARVKDLATGQRYFVAGFTHGV